MMVTNTLIDFCSEAPALSDDENETVCLRAELARVGVAYAGVLARLDSVCALVVTDPLVLDPTEQSQVALPLPRVQVQPISTLAPPSAPSAIADATGSRQYTR